MDRRLRIYPPVIVTALVVAILSTAGVASIGAEAEQAARQQQEAAVQAAFVTARPMATLAPQATPEATPEPETAYTTAIHSRDWGAEDSERLLKIAMAEAEGESVEGKALVMLVVLNRVWDDAFPDTIEEVLFQRNQFSPMVEGGRYWTTEPDEGCYEALALVENGWDESQGALYFESTGKEGWHSQNLEFLFQLGGHKFYR